MADKRRLPPEKAATIDEVMEAIQALTPAQLHTLGRFAHYRLEAVRRATAVNTAEDLLQEVITRTLSGDRSWNKKAVDFIGHLIGVIKSMTSHLGEKKADPITEADTAREDNDANAASPLETTPAAPPSSQRALHAKERVKGVEQYFQDEPLILNIIAGFRESMTANEIADVLEVTENEIESALRKIRRHRKNIATEGKTHA